LNIVETTAILEPAIDIVAKEISVQTASGTGHRPRFVVQVRKRKYVYCRETLHIVERIIFNVGCCVHADARHRVQSSQASMFNLRYDFPTEWSAIVNVPGNSFNVTTN
jgi:hypothetical protein